MIGNKKLTVAATLFILFSASLTFAQKVTVQSPNQKVSIALFSEKNNDVGEWFMKASYNSNGKSSEAIPRIEPQTTGGKV